VSGQATRYEPVIAPGSPVLFDMDGTLVLSEHVHRRVWERFFADWRLDVDEATYARTYLGRRAGDVLAQVDGPWRGTDLHSVLAGLAAHSHELAGEVEAVGGARDLVRELHRRGHRIAVVTSAGREWARRVLGDVLGLADALELVVTAEDVSVGKPSPEGYLTACRLLAVDPACCTAVEDSPSGVQALAAAGVGTIIGVTTSSPAAELRGAGAGLTVPDLRPEALLCG
jgi:sugar-phosphatase